MNRLLEIRASVATLLLCVACSVVYAQGVGINGTGASADPSAMLDLSSTTKGFLPPRMTAAQRAAIFSPATGLLVYQTDGTVGLYYNAGTPSVPNWQVAGAGAAGQWSVSGANLYYTAGKIGIGTTPISNFGLTVIDSNNGLRVQTNVAGGSLASFGGVGTFGVDGPGVIGGRLQLLENGNLGIGNAVPTNPLSFAGVVGKKISLFHDVSGGDYGLGISSGRINLYSGSSAADVAIGYDNVGTFVEKFAVKPTGALAVSGNSGAAGQVLRSNGPGQPVGWASPGTILQAASTGTQEISGGGGWFATVPGLSLSVTIPAQGANVLVQYSVQTALSGCVVCTGSSLAVFILIDGGFNTPYASAVGGASTIVPAGVQAQTVSGSQVLTGLSAGVHTVIIQATTTGGQNVSVGDLVAGVTGMSGLLRSTLIAQVIPN